MKDCLFCKINSGEIPSPKLYEDELMFVIRDIDPKAKCHYLAIPKAHYARFEDMTAGDVANFGTIFSTIAKIAPMLGLENGYRLVINQGSDGGQTVNHVHIHVLGGEELGWTPN